jgi:glycerophosphoryl diester phosphodiesterase
MMPPPIVIAHRGASGYLPEHTLAAKALAHGLGADFLEQDVVATRDAQLVVLHDLYLDDVTDVAVKFPGRNRNDGRHYVRLRPCRAQDAPYSSGERPAPRRRARRFAEIGLFGIATLSKLELIAANRSTGRVVISIRRSRIAVAPSHGIDLKLVLAERAFGYSRAGDAAFRSMLHAAELARLKQARVRRR